MKDEYSNREIDRMFKEITDILVRIEEQTTKTNGRVTRLEKLCLVFGVALLVTIVLKFPELMSLTKLFI
jgi:hypothetical protein